MIEILNLRKTATGFLINGLTETALGDENYQNALDWEASGKEVMPMYAESDLLQLLRDQKIAHYKSLYLGVVDAKLKELDYDSLATVKLWEGDATFGAEATRILIWYKAIILKNYQLLTAGIPMTDEEYLASINAIVF